MPDIVARSMHLLLTVNGTNTSTIMYPVLSTLMHNVSAFESRICSSAAFVNGDDGGGGGGYFKVASNGRRRRRQRRRGDETRPSNNVIYNSPFSMCTLIIAGFATNESQAYTPLSVDEAFCISRRLLVIGPLMVTKLMPPLGESKFIGCWKTKKCTIRVLGTISEYVFTIDANVTTWLQQARIIHSTR